MADAAIQIAETIQTASIKRNPSPTHDINPSTAASEKRPVEVDDDVVSEAEEAEDDEIPVSVLRPTPRRANLPPLPDLRFEQSYLASIQHAETWQRVAFITIKDQVIMPLMQGMVWTLVVAGWRHMNRASKFSGQSVGAKIRRWWWETNNWKLPQLKNRLADPKLAANVEEVFMTSRDRIVNIHEPFGDAFYFGPERLGTRYENDERSRIESGFAEATYKSVFDDILAEGSEGKRIFIKDIAHYLSPPHKKPAAIAPSLQSVKRGVGTSQSFEQTNRAKTNGESTVSEPGNPTVVPSEVLRQFHFGFLIRHPKHSIPSYWRCTIPPLDKITGFYNFMPEEAGYDELRRIFDYMKDTGIVGPKISGQETNGTNGHTNGANVHNPNEVPITLVDADDLLDNPEPIMRKFCEAVGIKFDPQMLEWDTEVDHQFAKDKFEKWKGFHEDAINSTGLHARKHGKPDTTPDQDFEAWKQKYGEEAAVVIRDTVEACLPDYEYLKQFAIKA
ncbi:hypothetical protein B9Z65_3139 [Elsinoe australis]|uniref:Uncharacterized protein n=1 Tax=Elsinoe australis TaxID=40998 RepID=A0A2P7ZUI7_9PEZI|nr:hypothetical protein B9Z65_3139 [Elsinoe australis]